MPGEGAVEHPACARHDARDGGLAAPLDRAVGTVDDGGSARRAGYG